MPRMGDYADLSMEGGLYGPGPEQVLRRDEMPLYVQQAAEAPRGYEVGRGMWPQPQHAMRGGELVPTGTDSITEWRNAPPPNVGAPLVGNGGQFSPGTRVGNRVGDLASQVAYDAMMPSGPLDVGMSLATGPGRFGYKVAAGALGALAQPTDAEAARWIKYPFNRIAVGDTIENLMKRNQFEQTKQIVEKQIQPHDIPIGSWLTPLVGDRSRSGGLVTHIGDKELPVPVKAQGGREFVPEWQKEGIGWASDPGAAGTIAGRARNIHAMDPGADVYGVYTTMGPHAIDASHHISDSAAQLMLKDSRKISKTAIEQMDERIRQFDPDFPGVKSKKLQEHMRDQPMSIRSMFVAEMNKKSARDAGFPDIEQVRLANTLPDLVNRPNYSGGQSIAKLTGEVLHGEKGASIAPHYTYRSKLPAEYMGGLASAVPQEILWRDFTPIVGARNPSAAGKIWLTGLKGEGGEQLMKQRVDAHWQDTNAEYLRKNPMGALLKP